MKIKLIAEEYAGRLHACLLGAGLEPPRQEWLAAHFRDAIAAALAQSGAEQESDAERDLEGRVRALENLVAALYTQSAESKK